MGDRRSDERLARAVGAGDEAAFAAIDARYRRALLGYAVSIVRHRQDGRVHVLHHPHDGEPAFRRVADADAVDVMAGAARAGEALLHRAFRPFLRGVLGESGRADPCGGKHETGTAGEPFGRHRFPPG